MPCLRHALFALQEQVLNEDQARALFAQQGGQQKRDQDPVLSVRAVLQPWRDLDFALLVLAGLFLRTRPQSAHFASLENSLSRRRDPAGLVQQTHILRKALTHALSALAECMRPETPANASSARSGKKAASLSNAIQANS